MSNYATINLTDVLARLPGVGNVTVFGAGSYAMRIWMDPQKLQSYGLQPKDVIDAIRSQNQNIAAGMVGMPPAPSDTAFQYTVDVQSRLDQPEQFANIVVKNQTAQGGRLIHVSDIGRVELGAQTYSQNFQVDGKPAAGIAIFQTPEANSLQVGKEIDDTMAKLSQRFPEGLHYAIPYDTTIFVKDSIAEVYKTLYEAGILVLIVILVFLQNFRATLVPATTVPVTIIGAFAGMAALGFTVNLSTLFGIVLAIGIVVDDAIVIVEGVTKNIEQGMSGHDAAIQAMNDLIRSGHRHHPGADGGVPSGGVRSGPHRQHVRPVRARHRRDRADQRGQRRDAEADPMRVVASHPRPAGKAKRPLPLLQSCLRPDGARLHGPHWPDGPQERAHGHHRALHLGGSASGPSSAFRPPSSRSTTRAICCSPSNCRKARRSAAPPRRWKRRPRPRSPFPESIESSRTPECRCSTTAPTSSMSRQRG